MSVDRTPYLAGFLALMGGLVLLSTFHPAHAQSDYRDLQRAADRFLETYVQDGLVDYRAVSENPDSVEEIEARIDDLRLERLRESDQKAFLINAYNLLVIGAVAEAHPIESPLDVAGFFDGERHPVAGTSRTLDGLEAEIFERFPDARIHFALVCAAESCPPLPDSTFRGPVLDRQLEAITRQAIRSDAFVRIDSSAETIHLSRIFDWYRSDFEQESGSLTAFIDRYRERPLPDSYTLRFTEYDWSLNEFSPASGTSNSEARPPDGGPNVQRLTGTTLIGPGRISVKQFNNLYTQTAYFDDAGRRTVQDHRSTYFTGILDAYVGVSSRMDVGLELYAQAVEIGRTDQSPFSSIGFGGGMNARGALTAIVPKIKVSPPATTTSFQAAVLVPLQDDLDGADGGPFLAHGDPELWLQAFRDLRLASNTLLYLEGSLVGRLDGRTSEDHEVTAAARSILNYYLTDRLTLYALGELAPSVQPSMAGLRSQVGAGLKLRVAPGLQVELLSTAFPVGVNEGAGVTYNLGMQLLR